MKRSILVILSLVIVVGFLIGYSWWVKRQALGPAASGPAQAIDNKVPDWVPAYPFTDKTENKLLRHGAGSYSFQTQQDGTQVYSAYAAKLKEAGWKVETDNYSYADARSPDGQKVVAVVIKTNDGKTSVAVAYLDYSLALKGQASPPEGIPNWVPIYPGQVGKISSQGNTAGFTITTAHNDSQVSDLYAGLLRASGYKVETSYESGYSVRGTAESPKRYISVNANTKDNTTTITVIFEPK